MSGAKALKYAEEELGVHKIYESTQGYLEDLDIALGDLDKAQDARRKLDETYADLEVELINNMRGVHPNMSDTRFKSEFKIWEREDKALSDLRVDLNKVRSDIQGLEYDIEILKLRIKTGSSRMVELGGYLNYLAVIKQGSKTQAESTNKEK